MESITGLPTSTQIKIIRRYADEKKFGQIKKNGRVAQTQSGIEDYQCVFYYMHRTVAFMMA